MNKSDIMWNWSFNMPCKSLKVILVLFEEEESYAQDSSKSYNPKIENVSVTVEGKPNQIYSQRMRLFEQQTKFASILLKESRKTPMIMRFKKN